MVRNSVCSSVITSVFITPFPQQFEGLLHERSEVLDALVKAPTGSVGMDFNVSPEPEKKGLDYPFFLRFLCIHEKVPLSHKIRLRAADLQNSLPIFPAGMVPENIIVSVISADLSEKSAFDKGNAAVYAFKAVLTPGRKTPVLPQIRDFLQI
ncbi:MAG: hypothetical protein GX791_00050 [Synergistaceae bacterium]|nr:hypothetical protein [Synergistaceae bacterium]